MNSKMIPGIIHYAWASLRVHHEFPPPQPHIIHGILSPCIDLVVALDPTIDPWILFGAPGWWDIDCHYLSRHFLGFPMGVWEWGSHQNGGPCKFHTCNPNNWGWFHIFIIYVYIIHIHIYIYTYIQDYKSYPPKKIEQLNNWKLQGKKNMELPSWVHTFRHLFFGVYYINGLYYGYGQDGGAARRSGF